MTVQTIADAIGSSRSFVTLIENGRRLPGKRLLPKLAAALNLDKKVVMGWYLKDIKKNLEKIHGLDL